MRQAHESAPVLSSAAAQLMDVVEEESRLVALVDRIVDYAPAAFRADAVALHVFDAALHRLDLLKQHGFPEQFERSFAHLTLDKQTIGTRAVVTGKVQTVRRNVAAAEAATDQAAYDGFCELMSAPLVARGQTAGVLTFAARLPDQLGQLGVPTIEFVCHALAASIINTRAVEAEQRMRTALQAVDEATLAIASELEPQRVLQALVDRAREVIGARYAALGIGTDPSMQFDPWVFSGLSEEHARAIGHFPRPQGLLGAVSREGKTIRVPDLSRDPRYCGFPPHHPPMRSFLGVPIQAVGESIGNLYLTDKIGADEFSAEDERAAASLAAHAAVAIQHARLYEQAQRERTRLQAVLEGSPLGIIFVEGSTDFVYANRAAEELLGRHVVPSAGTSQYMAQVLRPDGRPLSLDELPAARALRGEPVVGLELVLRRPDGREVPVLANAASITDGRGRITGAVVLWQDITPLKLEQLREEFISVVAHELRAPIGVIAGYAQLLSKGQRDEMERRAAESIHSSTRRLERMVRDLLDASRIEARRLQLEKRPIQIASLVEDVTKRLTDMLGNRPVRVKVRGEPAAVEADPIRIEQILTNLLTNAAKYSPPNTDISIVVEAGLDEVVVTVADQGQGIPAEEIPRLFTRYYRTHGAVEGQAPGVGLGLYIARGLVEAHGGRIWVTSEPGQGAAFSFALPTRA